MAKIYSTTENIEENGIVYEVIKHYKELENGEKKLLSVVKTQFHTEPVTPKPSQLDRIESMISKSQEQITKEARDAYTLELINSGII